MASNYDYNNPTNGGAFTRLIWKSTEKLGVGISIKYYGQYKVAILVAHLYGPGNTGDFKDNVMHTIGISSIITEAPYIIDPIFKTIATTRRSGLSSGRNIEGILRVKSIIQLSSQLRNNNTIF